MMIKILMLKRKMRMQPSLPITLSNKRGVPLKHNLKHNSSVSPLQPQEWSRKKRKKLKEVVALSRNMSLLENLKIRKVRRVEMKISKLQISKKREPLLRRTILMTPKKISLHFQMTTMKIPLMVGILMMSQRI